MKTALQGPVRVRFAPSPTGFLHVGGARTAIYNDLLRQSLGGRLVLRIEDTDQARSDPAMTRQIQEALAWVGVVWDEGPHLQSERLARHRERALELVAAGRAYPCFCTAEELEPLRREAEREGRTFRYPRSCLARSPGEVARRRAAGEPHVVRFRMPEGGVRFTDLVRGEMEFSAGVLDDFVLLRSDGTPTYHLSVVVDDLDMGITLVLRGEDHLSNTPKHVPLFEALGGPVPQFAHLPLILGTDKKRLSKRTGATSVEEFRAQGVLPEALYNYLALLGWSPGDEREILTRDELIAAFTVERLGSSASVFDPEKLLWVNGQYLWKLPLPELLERLEPFLPEAGLAAAVGSERLATVASLHQVRARTLRELALQLTPYFRDEVAWDPEAGRKYVGKEPRLAELLAELAARYGAAEPFAQEELERLLRELAEARGVKAAALIHPTRMALTGTTAGPPLFDVVEALGRETAVARLEAYAADLEGEPPVGEGGEPPVGPPPGST
jgi:glutamyl-tRNA synthetase